MKRVCIGAGQRLIDGFINVDLFDSDRVVYARANNLHMIGDSEAELIFSNAVFEHISEYEYQEVFKEWHRILSPTGVVVCLGIPYFNLVAKSYFDGKLDLKKVHNYTTGVIEYTDSAEWLMGQIHKGLFNKEVLYKIFLDHGFSSYVFNYCYPSEDLPVNLGVIAFTGPAPGINYTLESIPTIENYIRLGTIEV